MNSTASTVQIFWAASASIFKLRHCVKGWDQGEGSRGQVIDRGIKGTEDHGDRSLIKHTGSVGQGTAPGYGCLFSWQFFCYQTQESVPVTKRR